MASPLAPRVLGGLQLHVTTEPEARSGAVYLWFDVGAVDEAPDEAGAAHFLEHMLFKGTAALGVGEAAARVEGMGGDLNAWTSADELVLHAVVPAEDTLAALDVLLDMASRPRMDPAEVERERLVILDEIRGYADDAETVASDALQASLFPEHPYGRPVLGTEASVSALRREQLVAFHRRHVHPGRAILVVTSPWPADAVEERLRPWLGSWGRGDARQPRPWPAAPGPGRAQHLRPPHGGATVHLAVPTVGHGHPDLPALDVLAACLGQGAAALLPEALELEAGAASGSWAALSTQRAGGALELGFQVGHTEEAVPLALDVLDAVVLHGVDGERVARAIDGIGCDLRFAHETVDGRTADRVFHLAVHGDAGFAERQRRRLAAVTTDEVRDVARRYLGAERRHLVVVDRDLGAGHVRRWHRRTPRRAAPPADTPRVIDLGGMTAVLLPDGSPLAAIHVLVRGGQLLDGDRVGGVAQAWARLLTRGAGMWDASAFAARVDALAMVLDGYAGRASGGLHGSLPADRLGAGLGLVADALLEPHLDPVDVDHVVEELLDDEAARNDRASTVAQEAVAAALFPGHPWGRPSGGTAASLERIRPATVGRLHRRAVVRSNLVVAVAGGASEAAVREHLQALAEALPDDPAPVLPSPERPPRGVRSAPGGQTQAAVVLGARLARTDPHQRRLLAVLAALLEAQSGRLFMELREDRGLAYGVWAAAEAPSAVPHGAFVLGLTVDPQRAEEARQALRHSWERLLADGPGPDELARTTRMLAGHAALARERVGGRARALLHHVVGGQPYDLDEVRRLLLAVDVDALRPLLDELRQAPTRMATATPEGRST